ncbi:SRPBCC domain-containing protein [Luteipulveratus sp. YIM 133132]|uniref:SRPBCC domain-containing protein n=1 Tax=Luteipulveratus flavus TaxID=3031728 RepID=A0ABT6CBG3_9MICO|nr:MULTISPECIES: SRPBCC domain-containing protein [unclassified Luteipulveratus]MDE9367377.1 SRPBCC domain-containing protein [Luteipulveratus sp. YIM 133132]MDF8266242.1 SRPBCC domain-containing protein [Luteipulveratus sp. YIM 133296]
MPADDVVLSYDLPVPARRAFYLYVDRIGRWWPGTYTNDPAAYDRVVIEPRVGGRVLARYTGGHAEDWGTVRHLDPAGALEHSFNLSHRSGVPSVIRVEFSDHDSGSRMRFRHTGWNRDNSTDRHRFNDWPLVLSGYVDHVRRAAAHQD